MARRALVIAAVLAGQAQVAWAQQCSALPVLFIVQDKSGSMAGVPDPVGDPSAPSKWASARAVVPALVSTFSNRFRFGAMMFPGATTTFACTTGAVVAPLPSTPAQVDAAYAAAAAGGGTPTQATLSAARQYLLSAGLTTPAYVLLITDGMPNCNLGLDEATCQNTTWGCLNTNTCSGASCCGLGAKDCLDDSGTAAAAGALRAAGIPTYVVGFGSGLTSGNNKAVLDAVAAAGGTGSSYVVSNQASLQAALNQIALNTSTCCTNACTAGATRCAANGAREVCQLDAAAGCTTWSLQSCPSMSACVGGQCQACSNQCSLGATRCASGDAQTCVAGAGGCTQWQTTQSCGYGELCGGGQCGGCQACSLGAARCTAAGAESCEWDLLSGCTRWQVRTCGAGTRCLSGACQACTGTCTAGARRCSGSTAEACVADAAGCTSWQALQTCTSFCSGGACGSCGTTCTAGQTRCNGNGVETCGTDAHQCPAWSPTQPCAAGSFCAGSACQVCATQCTAGARRCGANGAVEECGLEVTGCTTWSTVGACILAAGEHCEQGVCVPQCLDVCVEGSGRCSNGAPQRCQRVATGCTAWAADPACGAAAVCVEGACRATCGGGEMETCPAGQVCTGLTSGSACLPDLSSPAVPDAGSDGGGGGGGSGGSSGGVVSTGTGCSCAGVDGGGALLALLALLTRRRKGGAPAAALRDGRRLAEASRGQAE